MVRRAEVELGYLLNERKGAKNIKEFFRGRGWDLSLGELLGTCLI